MSCSLQVPEERQTEIHHLFKTMNRSDGTHSDALAIDWLKKHGQSFAGFVNGTWLSSQGVLESTHKIADLFSGRELAQIHLPSEETIQAAEKNSLEGFQKWSCLTAVERSKYIYKIGKNIEENLQLFSMVESIATGKHLYKTRNQDVLNLIQVFYHDSTLALQCESWCPNGVICVVAEEFNDPLLSMSWRLSSILAAGSSAFLLVNAKTCLSAFLLCELCSSANLPPGVLNVLPICDETQAVLSYCSKVVFTGSTKRSNIHIDLAIRSKIPIEISTPQRTTVIVYSGADLHAAANSVLAILAFNDTRAQNSGCNVLYQDSVEEEFLKLLKEKFSKIVVGGSFTNSDLSCIVTDQQKNELDFLMKEEQQLNAEITFGPCIDNVNYTCYRPVLLCNARTAFKNKCSDIKGPIVFGSSFRTVKESISMFNHDRQASAVSLWTQNISVGLEVASKLKTTVVWMNSHNIFKPQVIHSSLYLSGNLDHGGDSGLISYSSINKSEQFEISMDDSVSDSDTSDESSREKVKLFSDVQNAVSCALAAQPKWQNTPKGKRTQIFLSIAENLKNKKEGIAAELEGATKIPLNQWLDEIGDCIHKIIFYASFDIDSLQKSTLFQESSLQVLQHRLPLGVIGVQCPDKMPFLSFVSLVLPAVVFGNVVVAIPSQQYPQVALKIFEIFKASGVPSGVINVISGERSFLTQLLSNNIDVGAIWFTGYEPAIIYRSLKVCPKKIFYCNNYRSDSDGSLQQILKFSTACTYNKAIYLPFGDIFAN